MNWAEGKPIQLWEIRPGVFAWTFSYHQIGHESEPVYHWHSSLTYYQSEGEAKEAMANFVAGLNATWSKVNAENS